MSNTADGAPLLGIDLGTSTCEACVSHKGSFHMIQPDRYYYPRGHTGALFDASYEMPSAFAWLDGNIRTGQRALDLLIDQDHAGSVVVEIKRSMDREGIEPIRVGELKLRPSEIAGYYVQVLRIAAEKQLGLPDGAISGGVVTIPASFGQTQIEATLKACQRGGLIRDRVRLIDEPVAAAYSLKLHERPGKSLVLVADIGGGTFDVTLLRVGRDVSKLGYEELGRDGELFLGGLDWDREIAHRAAYSTLFQDDDPSFITAMLDARPTGHAESNKDARIARTRLFEAAERAKRMFYDQFPKTGPFPTAKALRKIDVEFEYKSGGRTRIGEIPAEVHLKDTAGLVARCVGVCERMLLDVSDNEGKPYGWKDINEIFLAGGGSRMATVRNAFAVAWGRAPQIAKDPQHAVAYGAALCAEEVRLGRDVEHLGKRRYPHAVGIANYSRSADGGELRSFTKLVSRHAVIPFPKPIKKEFYIYLGASNNSPLEVEIEEESAALTRPTANGAAIDEEQTPPTAASHQVVKTLTMRNLPPPIDSAEDTILIEVNGNPDGLLRFHLECRGREMDFEYDRGRLQ